VTLKCKTRRRSWLMKKKPWWKSYSRSDLDLVDFQGGRNCDEAQVEQTKQVEAKCLREIPTASVHLRLLRILRHGRSASQLTPMSSVSIRQKEIMEEKTSLNPPTTSGCVIGSLTLNLGAMRLSEAYIGAKSGNPRRYFSRNCLSISCPISIPCRSLQRLRAPPASCKLFYKKECQEKYFTPGWRPRVFSAFSPLSSPRF
jgi:hypothetical protein